jgi:amino acid adenylation domain-containing protein
MEATLNRDEQLHGLRDLAEAVLAVYGLEGAGLTLLEYKLNITFRVDGPAPGERFLLRLCLPARYGEPELRSEVFWLLSLRQAGVPAPDPVPARDGSLVPIVAAPGFEPRAAQLFRWIPGKPLEESLSPELVRAAGRLLGRLHAHAERFQPPAEFERPRWDLARLIGDSEVFPDGSLPGGIDAFLSGRDVAFLEEAGRIVRAEVAQLGQETGVWGLIHTDLEPDNLIVEGEAVHPIDFEHCGWGWYLYDIAASLLPMADKPGFPELRKAFLQGYSLSRPAAADLEARLDAFLVVRGLFSIRLILLQAWHLPVVREEASRLVPYILGGIRRILSQRAEAPSAALSTVQLMARLRTLGIRLWMEGEALRFSAPKGVLDAALKGELTARKPEILQFLLRASRGAAEAPPPIPLQPRDRPLPLSFPQQRLWFIDQMDPGTPAYNLPVAVRVEGSIEVPLLRLALDEVVRRHEVMRTTFAVGQEGEPVQVIASSRRQELPVVDLRALPAAQREAEARLCAAGDAVYRFDLAAGPLLRTTLIWLAAAEYVLLTNTHHVVSDGWSGSIFVREVGALYTAFLRGEASPLPELPLQYADYAAWQRDWMRGEVLAGQIAWWKERLAGAPALLELPTDRPRPAVQSHQGLGRTVSVPRPLTEALAGLAQREGATLFMLLLATLSSLLARYSNQESVVIGSGTAGRTRPELEDLIGFFINMLVLRADLGGEPSWRDLIAQVRRTVLEAFQHQEVPFEKLVEELAPPRNLGHAPIFQVAFTLQNVPGSAMRMPGAILRLVPVARSTTPFDLALTLEEGPAGLMGSLRARRDLFDEATVERMLQHLTCLLGGLVGDPGQGVLDTTLLSGHERAQMILEWNDVEVPCPQEPMVHELASAHARRDPGATAVDGIHGRLTYGELEARANRLAWHLRRLGVGPEVRVAVCMERVPERVIGIFAVLKAGGAYVSLDPTYPRERLAFLFEDAAAPVLLTQQRFIETLPETGAVVICLDGGEDHIFGDPERPPESGVTPGNLAYVVYTSGSTGRPKGVDIPHAGLMNLVRWHQRLYSVEPADRGTQIASPAFDASIWELWPYLAAGASVHIPDEETRLSSAGMIRWWSTQGITLAYLMTPLAEGVLEEEIPPGLPLAVRALIIGGDRLHRGPDPAVGYRLMNHYGPAEYTVTSTVVQVPPRTVDGSGRGNPTIGRVIDNTQIYILDRRQRPVPIGVPGELYVAGIGIARGYAHRPSLTAEKFVPDPFSETPGTRMYRTADLVRYLPDGDIDFLGRMDHQVKLRGFRIELGEIEAAILRHPHIEEAAVLVREEGGKRLVGYVVTAPGEEQAAGELRSFLQQSLPDYMVPSVFLRLEALPQTPNGKVDRRALPVPETLPAGREIIAPRTLREELLAGIWADVLGVERVGVEESFFELGGHSLLATQVVSRLRESLGLSLPLRALFEAPTVAELAHRLDLEERGDAALPIPRADRALPLPLSFAQERLWFLDQLEPGSARYGIPALARLHGNLNVPAFAAATDEIVRRHEVLRTTFALVGAAPVQVVAPARRTLPALVDLTGLPEARREPEALCLAREEALRPFDLGTGPLIRRSLLRLGAAEHVLLAAMHHIVSDGWSVGVLLRELGALYDAFSAGRPSPLPELAIQYADFAVWQRVWLGEGALEHQLAWWRERLAGAPAALELSEDRPRPAQLSQRSGRVPVRLPAGLSRALAALSQRQGATLFMTLLGLFQALLGRHAGTDDVVVGSPIAGRTRAELEPLIGFFVNTLALRGDLTGAPSSRELLRRVRETALGAYAHQDVPFEKLVEELAPQRDLSRTPLFQVMFVLQNVPAASLELPGLSLAPLSQAAPAALFDLQLTLSETADGLTGAFDYAADLFDPPTIERFLHHFALLLAGATDDPGRPVEELPLLSPEEEQQLLASRDRTKRTYALPLMVHDLLARQAARTPGATAAVGPQGEMTYREIEERSATLAAWIGNTRLDRCIGLLADPDPQVLVGMIGILKAGGAFVPMDPRHPDDRLTWALEDSDCDLVVTQRRHRERVAELAAGCRILCLEDTLLPAPPAPTLDCDPHALAYVVYTSGSTGRPKGVQISHESLVPMLVWGCEYLSLGGHTRALQSLSFCFDFGIFEHLTTLLAGGTFIFPGEAAGDPQVFAREIASRAVNTLHTTPAFARELAATAASLESLEVLHLGGEALSQDTVARLREVAPRAALYNGYGPTEATINSSIYRVSDMAEGGWPTVPIGWESADNSLYILDRMGRPVPFGVRGELYVGGIGVARGYLNRPELTAERFVPDLFGELPGGRLYRTGDLVRLLPSGDIAFLGRMDQQVKIRGFRVEPGEIEASLREHPAVREAAVVARAEPTGNLLLVAYVVAEIEAPELRTFLAHRLPPHMVPSFFVPLAMLPRTPNGKLDRRALPEPERIGKIASTAPRTPVEELVAGVWVETLGLDRIGVEESFFDLGGHSLLATRVASRLRDLFGITLPLRVLFEAPTVAGLARRIEAEERGVRSSLIVRADRSRPLPLSFAQERLWFLDQLEPGSARYNIPVAVRLLGCLDAQIFAAATDEIVRRHEALRTTFASAGEAPVQIVGSPRRTLPSVVDLTNLPTAARDAEAAHLATKEALCPFDLAAGPLLRLSLLRLAPEEHMVLGNLHHIVSDGWSVGVLVRELGALYEAFTAGCPSPLPELAIQYADFAVWQRQWLEQGTLAEQIAWWREHLAGLPTALDLPTDRPRPAMLSSSGGSVPVRLPADLSAALAALGRREGTTLFMTLLCLFQIFLGRHAGSEDVAVGSPIAGRTRAEIEALIGFFVNTLVLRTDLSAGPTVRRLLARVRDTALGAYVHQDVPFEKLVEELAPARHLGRTPLFQVMFALQNTPGGPLELPGLRIAPVTLPSRTTKFDLSLVLTETAEGLVGSLDFSADLFDLTTAVRWMERFQVLLAAAVAAPDRTAADLPIITELERFQVLAVWNDTEVPPLAEPFLHRRLLSRITLCPQELALIQGERRLTFGELRCRAESLACRLTAQGVGPEVVVGLRLERSPDLVVAALAVLTAGGAYLPLDLAHPEERQAFLLSDAAARLVIVREPWPAAPAEVEQLILGDEAELSVETTTPYIRGEDAPESLAYVLYTSGSTGRPKGVMVQHSALARYLDWALEAYAVAAGKGAPVQSSFGFDLTVTSLWLPLLAGRPVTLLAEKEGVEALASTVRPDADFSLVKLTPAHLDLLAQQIAPESVSGWARMLVVGGEALRSESLGFWRQHAPATRIVNEYGPTETVVGCSIYELPSGTAPAGSLPIGRPIAGARLYVLDHDFQPTPPGVPGELWIGGEGVTRGYRRDPSKTAERFVPDPFAARAGARLYRSGDIARHRADGMLEYLGRSDHQLKIRGFRIEPGEVESALLSHPAVNEAIVGALEDGSGYCRLVAWLTAEETAPSAAELRDYLEGVLPSPMVPSTFMVLGALPLSPNGKVDRRALPRPEERSWAAVTAAPRTPTEELVAGIWAEVLGREQVGVEESFFDLGGHSLLATQVVARVRNLFGVVMPLRALFEAPTVADLARRIESAERGVAELPIRRAERSRSLPLSFSQERLWFLDQLEPGSARYNIPAPVRLLGHLEVPVLAAVTAEIVRRHEVLRTTFAVAGEEPVQVIASSYRSVLPVVDLANLAAAAKDAEVARLSLAEALHPFDLTAGPLFRLSLLRLGREDHVILANLHHIISDGWSVGVLVRELGALYEAFLGGRPSPLPELALQYADFAAWQRDWLGQGALAEQLVWWRERLGGAPAVLELPTDRPRPAVLSQRGGSVPVHLPATLRQSLGVLSRRQGTTLFMTLLALFQALLSRHAGSEDVVVGSPIAGRTRPELEPLIGFFVNTLAMRGDLSGDPSVRELLRRVREVALGAYAHQDVPFEKLVEELVPQRDLGRTPLFQVMLVLQNAPGGPLELPGLRLATLSPSVPVAKLDLQLTLTEAGEELAGVFDISTDLFDAATAARLVERFQGLLEAAAAEPERRLSDLPLLTGTERHALTAEWNDTAVARPEICLHGPIEDQALLWPDRVALVFEGISLTYSGLEEQANRLAHFLHEKGVGPEVVVGVCMERSLDLVITLLGVLKTGGAYVPLDPFLPRERLAWMMEDSGAVAVVTVSRWLEALPAGAAAQAVCLDLQQEALARQPGDRPSSVVSPESLAYVIFTSGSTGRPKGVMNRHGAVGNRMLWMREAFTVTEEDRILQKTPFSFDVSVWDLFWPLMNGLCLVLARPEGHRDSAYLAATLAAEQITWAHFVPSMLRAFLEEEGLESCRALRRVSVSGEALSADLVERFAARLGAELLNLYGPTEAAVEVSYWLCRTGPRVPIGRPIANAALHVLDRLGRPVPIGVPGELHIGGMAVARGYARRPDLTAAAFLPDPFSEAGGRLYATGDRARWLPDGTLEYQGRLDHQVKVRGYRIEPGEIEAALATHPTVRESVVLAREGRTGSPLLVAYVVPSSPDRVDASLLLHHLEKRLPSYMVPSALIPLAALPLTPSGKVDRRALPAPELKASSDEAPAASTPIQELLAGIWAEVLGLERVGLEDNFFDLGGHSLLVTRVLSRLRWVLGVQLPVRALFEAPTVAELARKVEAEERGAAGTIPRVDRNAPLPLSLAQERLWFLGQLEPASPRFNIPIVVRLQGGLDLPALAAAFHEIVRRHEALRTTFSHREGIPFQVVSPAVELPLPLVDLSGLADDRGESEAWRQGWEETLRPFDLASGPLLRVAVLRLAEDDHVILGTMHHIISDGWSVGVLLREVGILYQAYIAGQLSPLPELAIQLPDFAAWQRGWISNGALEAQLVWWRERLSETPWVLDLPLDRPRPPMQSTRGANVEVQLAPELVDSILHLSRREGATLFMTLLGLFQVLLARHAGLDDILVGSPIANRHRSEVEPLIGFFVNLLTLRGDLRGRPSVQEMLARVREWALGAYAHQDLPFGRLVEELSPERDLSRAPLFQVLFTLQNAPMKPLELPGLILRGVPLQRRTATNYDLGLTLQESSTGLAGVLTYSTDLFDPPTVARLLERFLTLLASAVSNPQQPVGELPLVAASERHQLLLEWNDTSRRRSLSPLVHQMFTEHARRRPAAPAVVAGEQMLTYGELEARSNRLAHHLRSLGVGPEVRVALCAERTLQRVVGILGILKAGGAYVSLDPSYPRERLAFLLADAEAPVVLTEESSTANLPKSGASVLRLDQDWGSIMGEESAPPDVEILPESLAYVIYTSGSTGKPKGVEVPHFGLAHLVRWHLELYGMGEADRGTQVSSTAYDASVWDLWGCLAAGASSHIPDEPARLSPEGMVRWWSQAGITVTFVPTPVAEGILEQPLPPEIKVRELLIGGDRLHRRPGEDLPFRLMNHYGPAEYSVVSTVGEVSSPRISRTGESPPPIGRPIDDTRVFVVDRDLRPVPIGVPGELCVGGAGLARGYLRRPELTAQRFVPDPAGEPGARLYRTGDLVRWLPGGELDFLGRIDDQVKLRGQRIELGEIESVLSWHPAVREATVLLREDRQGDRRLVAYVVPAPGARPTQEALRNALEAQLPGHMVPAIFVLLEALPLTPNGKVDRRALPAPEQLRPDGLAPRDTLEMALVQIWEELLSLRPIGVQDDFFDLGGHSLLVMRLLSRIETRLGVRLSPAALFQARTVERLASAVRLQSGPRPGSPLVPLQAGGTGRPFFWIHPGAGSVFCYLPLAHRLGEERPIFGLQARGLDGTESPLDDIEIMAALYLEAVREAQPQGPYLLGGWSLGGVVAFEMARQLAARGEEVELLALVDSALADAGAGSAPDDTLSDLAAFARDLGLPLDHPVLRSAEAWQDDEAEEVLARLHEPMLQAGLLPPDLDAHDLRARFAVFRSHAEALRRYRPATSWPGRITLFLAAERPSGGADGVTQRWRALADGGLDLLQLPGDHYAVVREPAIELLAQKVGELLQRAEGAGRAGGRRVDSV